jgi:hypothetical protein
MIERHNWWDWLPNCQHLITDFPQKQSPSSVRALPGLIQYQALRQAGKDCELGIYMLVVMPGMIWVVN